MGRTEVTQDAYQLLKGNNPSRFKGPHRPVDGVSWDEAHGYCEAAGLRLPTEAEWEYAARGGSSESRYGDLDAIAWYAADSGKRTHDVAQKKANGYGLYDVLGNLWEWVADWYGPYPTGSVRDPQGPSQGQFRVLRGGAWSFNPRNTRVSFRNGDTPAAKKDVIGFRCAGESL
jgi:formylglycine-generating enzyme required for sulfatase activity